MTTLAKSLPQFFPLRLRLPAWPLRRAPHQRLAAGELRSMSDRELADLGIGRSEIDWQLSQEPCPAHETARGRSAPTGRDAAC
ncbi:MAG TPA: DUF1127 domain-containing protein [Ramlibacter sp.]|nr:DUF1127 domain-containing protein [Ramlibacter sp.]